MNLAIWAVFGGLMAIPFIIGCADRLVEDRTETIIRPNQPVGVEHLMGAGRTIERNPEC